MRTVVAVIAFVACVQAGLWALAQRHVSAPDVEGTLNRHRFELDRKAHRNKLLLEDWLRDGAENFRFEIVDTVKPRDDPAFDPAGELAGLLALWTEELGASGERSYQPAPVAHRARTEALR